VWLKSGAHLNWLGCRLNLQELLRPSNNRGAEATILWPTGRDWTIASGRALAKKEPVTRDRLFPTLEFQRKRPAEISNRLVLTFHGCSPNCSPTTPAAPAQHRHWNHGTANSRGHGDALCRDARRRLRTEPWTRQSAPTRQSSKSSSSFSSPLTQSRCEAWRLALAALCSRKVRNGRRPLLLSPTSRCGEQIFCSKKFPARYSSPNLLV
jgi:hypothetical protein